VYRGHAGVYCVARAENFSWGVYVLPCLCRFRDVVAAVCVAGALCEHLRGGLGVVCALRVWCPHAWHVRATRAGMCVAHTRGV
jgi:hypothetical protein